MTDLGWFYDRVVDANRERSTKTLIRRIGKLGEELGELWEAFLNVTSLTNGKNKTWEDVREEAVDLVIVGIDVLATRLPIDEGKSDEEIRAEIMNVIEEKLLKWQVSKTCKADAVSEGESI